MYGVVENFIGYNKKTKDVRRIQIADQNGWYRVVQLAEHIPQVNLPAMEEIKGVYMMETQVLVKHEEYNHFETLTDLLDAWTILESLGIQKEESLR